VRRRRVMRRGANRGGTKTKEIGREKEVEGRIEDNKKYR
jgi:hypothetical protein